MPTQSFEITNNRREKPKWYRSPKVLRHGVMAFFFLFLLHVAYDHLVKGGGPRGTPSIEAYCPFGGIENLYQFLTTGGYVRRIEPSAMIMLAALLLLTLLASRGFCGWICPFGSLQEWLGLLGRKIFKKRFNPTGPWDRGLRYLKYVILVGIIGMTWYVGALVFREYDPFLAFFHLGREAGEMPWAYLILGAVLVGSLAIERFFCKYACPLGAVLGVLGKFGLTRIRRDVDDCKGCNVCQTKCHAHIDFLSVTEIRDAECNHCMDCVVDCPKPNVLSVRGPRVRLSHAAYAALLVVGLFSMIGASKLSGKWQTQPETISFADLDGLLDAENIKGWMTLEDVSSGYSIPLDVLYSSNAIPLQVPPTARLNTIAKEFNLDFEASSVRDTVRSYLLNGVATAPDAVAETKNSKGAAGADHPGDSAEVKGFMTLNEITLKTGAPKEYFLKTLGLPSEIDGRKPVREWMHDHGKSIDDLRDAVAKYRSRTQ